MEQLRTHKIVVLALGNLIRSDDAVGLFALRELEKDPTLPESVTLVEGGTKGLELLPYICEAARLLILDSVDVGAQPGMIFRVEGQDLRTLPGTGSVHELALADLLNALRMMGREPEEAVLLGVQPSTTALGTTLSPPVQQALPALVDEASMVVSRWASMDEFSVPATGYALTAN
ncbi:MAG TPA: hydrogenase maturation protease [Candidatus Acidoferrum sp.]|nr:hydrogenase maturation protease [Candidatus Acidoferrum sp.]